MGSGQALGWGGSAGSRMETLGPLDRNMTEYICWTGLVYRGWSLGHDGQVRVVFRS